MVEKSSMYQHTNRINRGRQSILYALCYTPLKSAVRIGETDAVIAGYIEAMNRPVVLALMQRMVGRAGRGGVEARDARAAMWAARVEPTATTVMRTARLTDCSRSPCLPGDPGCR